MPVIRGQSQVSAGTAERRQILAEQLSAELNGPPTQDGPVIFEIPLEQQDRFDILAVWDAWEPFDSETRTEMIRTAYQGKNTPIAQALGVTYREAIEQQLLPYAVVPVVRPREIDLEELTKAMLSEGGIARENGKIELRFPTMSLAEQAHKRLVDHLPKGYWSITQALGYVR